jgi:cytochrome oxidase Cu insertion factor (SCO1/SenC/PrrC family)
MNRKFLLGTLLLLAVLVTATACGSSTPAAGVEQKSSADETVIEEAEAASKPADESSSDRPEWFEIELTNVNSGDTFKMADFQGKVVLIEAMAIWCPTCTLQQTQIQTLHEMLGERDDLVSVSLDVDLNETEDILKEYTAAQGFNWYFAVAPIEMTRAFGRLYSAQYVNPPVSPMMIIDRHGKVYNLPFGRIKSAQVLKDTLDPILNGG